ncbi:multiprotein-bridging factor 1 family protein [Nocardia sp. NPDC059177]|uniref:helix-turn-helix domain-containing protein n=1 Tax=Nocardia sp. NPDC059177 TaxID=3346759 RepID=UPI0036A8E20F
MDYRELLNERLARMMPSARAEYDAAHERAGLALRWAELCYEARVAAGLTQAELAQRMGTTQPTVARIEDGDRMPTVDMLERLSTLVGRPEEGHQASECTAEADIVAGHHNTFDDAEALLVHLDSLAAGSAGTGE